MTAAKWHAKTISHVVNGQLKNLAHIQAVTDARNLVPHWGKGSDFGQILLLERSGNQSAHTGHLKALTQAEAERAAQAGLWMGQRDVKIAGKLLPASMGARPVVLFACRY